MEIRVLSSGCTHCRAQAGNVARAVSEMHLDATVTRVEDMAQILPYNVLALPAIVVDGRVVHSGKLLSVEEVKHLLAKL